MRRKRYTETSLFLRVATKVISVLYEGVRSSKLYSILTRLVKR
jgi:hypothetical protein